MAKHQTLFLGCCITLVSLMITGCGSSRIAPNPRDTMTQAAMAPRFEVEELEESSHKRIGTSVPLEARDKYEFKGFSQEESKKKVVVFFEFDQAQLDVTERAKLRELQRELNDHPASHILVVGHCDWFGTQEYNLALGDRRAQSIRKYLIDSGVKAEQVRTLSRGSLDATIFDAKHVCWKDRRCDIARIHP